MHTGNRCRFGHKSEVNLTENGEDMIVERNVRIKQVNLPEWIEANLEEEGCQHVRLYSLSADEADDLLKDFCCRFREKFVLGKEADKEIQFMPIRS